MPYRQDGVVEDHPRAAPAHNLADGLPHLGLVAMSLAGTAEGLGLNVRAVVHPGIGIAAQSLTVRAEGMPPGTVVAMAVQLDHQAHGLFFLLALLGGCFGGHQLILPFSTE